MKLLRWAVAGASVYAVYKYSIGKKAKGESVLETPDKTIAKLTEAAPGEVGEETAEEAAGENAPA